uniref:Putative secreted protein n=1 Tax=Anopheles darlingi TaxID=43151 RepID=A0A2M4DK01_ANODA
MLNVFSCVFHQYVILLGLLVALNYQSLDATQRASSIWTKQRTRKPRRISILWPKAWACRCLPGAMYRPIGKPSVRSPARVSHCRDRSSSPRMSMRKRLSVRCTYCASGLLMSCSAPDDDSTSAR